MFQLFKRTTSTPRKASTSRQLFKRALSFAIGLVLLWVALNIMPEPSAASKSRPPKVETGETAVPGIEAASARGLSLLSGGQIAAGILLAGLLGFAAYRHKKTASAKPALEQFQNLGRLQLSPQQHLHLIGCGNDVFLIGATNNQISLLHRIAPNSPSSHPVTAEAQQEMPSPLYSAPSSTHFISTNFASQLQQQIGATFTDQYPS